MTTERNDNQRVRDALMIAIRRVREACDNAERSAQPGTLTSIQDVMHTFAWAFANASSAVENAMNRVETQHAHEIYALKRQLAEAAATGEPQA